MSNTSYYLYQKYIKYGSQDWIPVYPAEYAISGDAGQPPVIKQENDPNCGYYQPQYRWHQEDISEAYICSGGNKYYKEIYQVSYDNGFNWENVVPEQTRQGSLYESGSSDCIEYRWVNMDISTDWICSGTSKYYKQKKQWKYTDSSTWSDVVPAEYQMGALYEYNSVDCGYIPPRYRWAVTTGYICSGTNKMTKEIEQVSYDGGTTWQNVVPEESRAALPVIEYNSTDCGYIPHDYSKDYLTFIPISGSSTFGYNTTNTIPDKNNVVYYSLDSGSTWNSMASGGTVTVGQGNKIYWKASGLGAGLSGIGKFSSTGKFIVEGNSMSLVSGDSYESATAIIKNQFRTLFYGCSGLTSAENLILPATTLTEHCYERMFLGCTSLTTAPQLPATTLAYYCYDGMFSGCTSLTTATELPATTLANSCYYGMFQNCTSLVTAPQLPATTLANSCYYSMFNGCTSLTTAPELPVTTLAGSCYYSMFKGCTSLTTAPELPATTLVEFCYSEMFSGCTSLTTAPVLPATTLANYCYYRLLSNCPNINNITCLATDISATDCTTEWVYNVASSGTFTKASSMTGWTRGVNGIPNNWTVQNA